MTDYTYRVTIIVPEAHMADANQLALVVGENAADDRTFVTASHEDADGNLYAVASTVATPRIFTKMAALEAPTYAPDTDLVAAGRALAALSIVTTSEAISDAMGYSMTTAEAPVLATTGEILCVVGAASGRAQDHVALAGLAAVEVGV